MVDVNNASELVYLGYRDISSDAKKKKWVDDILRQQGFKLVDLGQALMFDQDQYLSCGTSWKTVTKSSHWSGVVETDNFLVRRRLAAEETKEKESVVDLIAMAEAAGYDTDGGYWVSIRENKTTLPEGFIIKAVGQTLHNGDKFAYGEEWRFTTSVGKTFDARSYLYITPDPQKQKEGDSMNDTKSIKNTGDRLVRAARVSLKQEAAASVNRRLADSLVAQLPESLRAALQGPLGQALLPFVLPTLVSVALDLKGVKDQATRAQVDAVLDLALQDAWRDINKEVMLIIGELGEEALKLTRDVLQGGEEEA